MSRVMVVFAVWQGLAAVTFAGSPDSSDWPQYLGPDRNSISQEKGLLRSWPESGPEVLWTVAADGTYGATELFTTEEFGDQTKPPILHNGYFYAQYGTNRRRDGLVCMSMDGQIMWKTGRSPDFNKGSMILADGLILATDGKKTLFLIEPDPSGFKPLASAELLGEGGADSRGISRVGGATQNWAPMALSDGKLLIRDQKQMKCVVVR